MKENPEIRTEGPRLLFSHISIRQSNLLDRPALHHIHSLIEELNFEAVVKQLHRAMFKVSHTDDVKRRRSPFLRLRRSSKTLSLLRCNEGLVIEADVPKMKKSFLAALAVLQGSFFPYR